MRSNRTVVVGVLGLVGLVAGVVVAGPLDPPSGPIASTGKVIGEIEPRIAMSQATTPGDATSVFRITAPGSYYLTGNVQGSAGKSGIVIAASNVSIDLNGFSLVGGSGSGSGITSLNQFTSLRICNGTVSSWGGQGVSFAGGSGVVELIISTDNALDGFLIGAGSVMRSCIAQRNASNGILSGGECVITNCTAKANAGVGIIASVRTHVIGCVATSNSGGFSGSFGSSIIDCTASLNVGTGILVENGCRVSRCYIFQNGFHGLISDTDGIITDNAVRGNGTGGTGAGIVLSGDDNRVEGNNCTDNKIGVQAFSGGNIIARNTCSGNTQNWNIAANNKCLVVLGANAGAITGDSGGASLGSTDPNANFTY